MKFELRLRNDTFSPFSRLNGVDSPRFHHAFTALSPAFPHFPRFPRAYTAFSPPPSLPLVHSRPLDPRPRRIAPPPTVPLPSQNRPCSLPPPRRDPLAPSHIRSLAALRYSREPEFLPSVRRAPLFRRLKGKPPVYFALCRHFERNPLCKPEVFRSILVNLPTSA